jgi:alkanesulfonate monooxygenase SsuD/methylene tetrahydromethanopterin reductase-like flavin-dependent oxidoreductase (luciferase family)
VPRSKQGHPVIIQAGQSGPGKRFAAKWGELLFVGSPVTLEHGRENYKQIKEGVAAHGRDPAHCVICPSAYIVSAATKTEAED